MESVCWDVQEQITEYLSSRDLESLVQVSTTYLLHIYKIYLLCGPGVLDPGRHLPAGPEEDQAARHHPRRQVR